MNDSRTDIQTGARSTRVYDSSVSDGNVSTSNVSTGYVTQPEPTLGDLFTGLTSDLSALVRQELELAKTEMQESAKQGAKGAAFMAIGGFLAYAGLILLLIALAVLVGNLLENYWLSTLLVGLAVVVIGGVMAASGKSQLAHMNLTPRKTIQTLEADAHMVKEKLS
jgi:uncharacterized membrane protein YqjE